MQLIISECIEGSKATTGGVLLKNLFLKIPQIQKKTAMVGVFFNKNQSFGPTAFSKGDSHTVVFL